MKRKSLILGIAILAASLGIAFAGSADLKEELDDFIQYYRSLKAEADITEDRPLSPHDLLENDLMPPQTLRAGASNAGPVTPASGSLNTNEIKVGPYETGSDAKRPDNPKPAASTPNDQRTILRGTPLNPATVASANSTSSATTSTGIQGQNVSATIITPTVRRANSSQ